MDERLIKILERVIATLLYSDEIRNGTKRDLNNIMYELESLKMDIASNQEE